MTRVEVTESDKQSSLIRGFVENLSQTWAAPQSVTKFIAIAAMNLVPPKLQLSVSLFNEPASGTQTCYANLTCGMSNPIFDDLKSLLQNFGLVETGGNFGLCNGEI